MAPHVNQETTGFHWPTRDDTCFIDISSVLLVLESPSTTSASARNYSFSTSDITKLNLCMTNAGIIL